MPSVAWRNALSPRGRHRGLYLLRAAGDKLPQRFFRYQSDFPDTSVSSKAAPPSMAAAPPHAAKFERSNGAQTSKAALPSMNAAPPHAAEFEPCNGAQTSKAALPSMTAAPPHAAEPEPSSGAPISKAAAHAGSNRWQPKFWQ